MPFRQSRGLGYGFLRRQCVVASFKPLRNPSISSADTGNSANYHQDDYTTGDSNYPMTDVGDYTLSESPYGTFDQGGNVWEWNEAVVVDMYGVSLRGMRGGGWGTSVSNQAASGRDDLNPMLEDNLLGFRVASIFESTSVIPEPTTFLVWSLLGLSAIGIRRRTRT